MKERISAKTILIRQFEVAYLMCQGKRLFVAVPNEGKLFVPGFNEVMPDASLNDIRDFLRDCLLDCGSEEDFDE